MIYDISPVLSPDLAVWPGDTPISRHVLLDMHRGDNLTLSTFNGTVHAGSHADAPSHYGKNADTVDRLALERYIGPCQVVSVVTQRGGRISHDDLQGNAAHERILFRTGTYASPETFNEDFAGVEPDLVKQLADGGVRLIGIDTPSVDLFSSKDLPAHHECLRRDVLILEGLVLDGVPDGVYELIALPLRLAGFDASPVRAILRTLDGTNQS